MVKALAGDFDVEIYGNKKVCYAFILNVHKYLCIYVCIVCVCVIVKSVLF